MANKRVIFYVDGFNFYYGLKEKGWKKYYWLDMVSFLNCFIKPHQELKLVNYFSASPINQGKHDRQDLFFQANLINPQFKLHLGKYIAKQKKCSNCNVIHNTYEEKETDVRIAMQMVNDVVKNECDISVIISADSDLVPPIEFIKDINPKHSVFAYFPPNRFSNNLKSLCNGYVRLDNYSNNFGNHLLPDEIIHPISGYTIKRPPTWI